MKRVIHLTVFLAVVAGLAGGLLSFVNDATLEQREAAAIADEIVNLEKIFPNAKFVALDESEYAEETGTIIGLFKDEGEGVVYKLKTSGYGGDIIFMLGIDNNDQLAGIEIISHTESPGFGDVIETDKYRDEVIGKASNDEIATLSGATVSTTATRDAIKIATDHYNANKGIDSEAGSVAEQPKLELGPKVALDSDEVARYEATIIDSKDESGQKIYTVEAEGYAIKDDEHKPDGKANIFEITVENDTITNVKAIEINDTKGIGTNIDHEDYYEVLIGIDLSLDQELDVVSNATYSSYSLLSAIKTVIENGQ